MEHIRKHAIYMYWALGLVHLFLQYNVMASGVKNKGLEKPSKSSINDLLQRITDSLNDINANESYLEKRIQIEKDNMSKKRSETTSRNSQSLTPEKGTEKSNVPETEKSVSNIIDKKAEKVIKRKSSATAYEKKRRQEEKEDELFRKELRELKPIEKTHGLWSRSKVCEYQRDLNTGFEYTLKARERTHCRACGRHIQRKYSEKTRAQFYGDNEEQEYTVCKGHKGFNRPETTYEGWSPCWKHYRNFHHERNEEFTNEAITEEKNAIKKLAEEQYEKTREKQARQDEKARKKEAKEAEKARKKQAKEAETARKKQAKEAKKARKKQAKEAKKARQKQAKEKKKALRDAEKKRKLEEKKRKKLRKSIVDV